MNKKIFTLILIIGTVAVAATIFAPIVYAQNANNNSGATSSPSLPNPLGKDANLLKVLLRIMQVALAAVDIFALFMFILGGFQFLISAGNPAIIKRAKDTLVWATIGILVITLSYSLMKFIFEAVQKAG
jgi:hypothetical protein